MRIIIHNHCRARDSIERGFVGQLYTVNGARFEESDLFIRPERAAEWVQQRVQEALRAGRRLVGKVVPTVRRV